MKRALATLQSPAVRWSFLAVALGLAVYAIAQNWHDIASAAGRLSILALVLAAGLSVLYVWLTLMSWRRILTDLGSPLGLRQATEVFGVSQVGKYVPGGVWNVVAAAELGVRHLIPRRRSVAAMSVAVLVSIITGMAVGCLALFLAPQDAVGSWRWVALATPVFFVLLIPRVLNSLIGLAFRVTHREPLEEPLTMGGLAGSTLWAVAAWAVAGLQVWIIATELGLPREPRTLALAVGGYALAWVVGFLVIFVPAGAGARELVLAAALGGSLPTASVVLVVLLSRAFLTVADLLFAAVAAASSKASRAAAPDS